MNTKSELVRQRKPFISTQTLHTQLRLEGLQIYDTEYYQKEPQLVRLMTQTIREFISIWSILFVCGVLFVTGILTSIGISPRYVALVLLLIPIPILYQMRTFSFTGVFLKNQIKNHCLKIQRKYRSSTICEFTGLNPSAQALLTHLNPGGMYFFCVATKGELTSVIQTFLEEEKGCRIKSVLHTTSHGVKIVGISVSQSAFYNVVLTESKVKPGVYCLYCWADLRPLGSIK